MTFRSQSLYDGWVLEPDEASGKGGTFDAGATTGRVGDDASDRQYRGILDFDTAGLPDDAVIVGVTLRIKKQAIVGKNPIVTHGLLLVDMKTGFYHDIQALEKYDFQAAGSRGNVGRFIKTPTDGWYRAPLRARQLRAGQPDGGHPVPAAVRDRTTTTTWAPTTCRSTPGTPPKPTGPS